jgi:hypothetical protein
MSPQKKLNLTFVELVSSIRQAHDLFSAQASKSVNISLTLRNWFIGMYITEYELHGADRAGYGENLFNELAAKLAQYNVSGCRFRQLYNYWAFYRAYPQILRTASAKSKELLHTIVHATYSWAKKGVKLGDTFG